MTLTSPEKNAFVALESMLKLSKVAITSTSLRNSLLQHPDFPRLTSLSDVLTEYNVPNLATRLDPQRLFEIPLPAIAHLENGVGYVTLTKIENNTIEWQHNELGKQQEEIHSFSEKWQGITLLSQPDVQSGEVNFAKNKKKELIESSKIPFALLVLFLMLCFVVYGSVSQANQWEKIAILGTKIIGIALSSMLLWYSLDNDNPILKKVCQLNNQTSCSSILGTSAASFFGLLTWSEIGLFYFSGGFLALLFSPFAGFETLKLFNFLALPYTLWSIYYQGFVAKVWCPLCAAVQVLLWAEFLVFQQSSVAFGFNSDWNILASFALIPAIWLLIKAPLQKSIQTDTLNNQLNRIRFSSIYTQGLLAHKRVLPPIYEGMNPIIYGNQDAPNTLILAITPTCSSCRTAYFELQELLTKTDKFKCLLVFAASADPTDRATEVVGRILSLPTIDQQLLALKQWFSEDTKNMKRWIENNKIPKKTTEGTKRLEIHLRWINLANITETPSLFLNAAEIPSFYKLTELHKILPQEGLN